MVQAVGLLTWPPTNLPFTSPHDMLRELAAWVCQRRARRVIRDAEQHGLLVTVVLIEFDRSTQGVQRGGLDMACSDGSVVIRPDGVTLRARRVWARRVERRRRPLDR